MIVVKSFSSLTDAERFLAGENPVHNVGLLSPTSSKFYAVKSGRIPGIYTDWPSAQAQITGWTKPRHKCFATRIEAQRFLNEEESKSTEAFDGNAAEHDLSAIQDALVRPDETMFKPAATKRTKRAINGNTRNSKTGHVEYNESDYQPGTGPLPPGMEDGFDSNIFLDPETGQVMYKTEEQRQATKIQMVPGGQTDPIRIYTDGSALGNGGPGAFAGVGVYFGPGDPRYSCGRDSPRRELVTDMLHQERIGSASWRSTNQSTRRAHGDYTSPRGRPTESGRDHSNRQPIRDRLRDVVVCYLAKERVENRGRKSGREQRLDRKHSP